MTFTDEIAEQIEQQIIANHGMCRSDLSSEMIMPLMRDANGRLVCVKSFSSPTRKTALLSVARWFEVLAQRFRRFDRWLLKRSVCNASPVKTRP